MTKTSFFHKESGNAKILALLAVLVIAGASFAYFATQKNQGLVPAAADAGAAASSVQAEAGGAAAETIKPGNPVVAKVDGKDITRLDVLNFVQTLPPQTRQLPLDQLFPLAVDQLVNSQIVVEKTKSVNLDDDPEVKKQLEQAKEQIVRSVYLQKEVEKKITDDKIKEAYDSYVKNFPVVQEVKARHILVKDEAKAKELIAKLDGGADFAALATENSTDGTAKNGGELGYFSEKEVVADFAKAAFQTEPATYTKAPVKTDFGYHVIKVEEKRQRPPAELEQAKPFLTAQLRRAMLDEMIKGWRREAKIETFSINGDKIEPSSGQEKPAEKAE